MWLGNVAKPSISKFEWIEDTSQFNEDFIKSYNKETKKGYFLAKLMFHTWKYYINFLNINLSFLSEIMKIENFGFLVTNLRE